MLFAGEGITSTHKKKEGEGKRKKRGERRHDFDLQLDPVTMTDKGKEKSGGTHHNVKDCRAAAHNQVTNKREEKEKKKKKKRGKGKKGGIDRFFLFTTSYDTKKQRS